MFTGRTQELKRLEDLYSQERCGIVVLYGRNGIGKTTLVKRFLQDKKSLYYAVRRVTEREQLFCIRREWAEADSNENFYELLKRQIPENSDSKYVLVLDEFRNLFEDSTELWNQFLRFYAERFSGGRLLVVLVSSSVNWVENEMTSRMGNAAKLLSGFLKLKSFSFMEIANFFQNSAVEADICTGAVLGGVPLYLRLWQDGKSVEENIRTLFLSEDAPLFSEAERYLKLELRELTAYNTILAALAEGKYKLNDMYEQTGFSRAKISVYIKNLTQLDITEKLFSFETEDYKSVQKGLYRIREPFLRFWYRFLYPNLSEIAFGGAERVWNTKIRPYLSDYVREFFSDVCSEYLQVLGKMGQLKDDYERFGVWYGKKGRIDVLAGAQSGEMLAGFCFCKDTPAEFSELEAVSELLTEAGIRPKEIYCFSINGFSEEFEKKAAIEGISLVNAKDM